MPNWCSNDLEIFIDTDEQEAMTELSKFIDKSIVKETVIGYNGEPYEREKLTFQGVCPRPSELDISSGYGKERTEALLYLNTVDGDLSDMKKYIKEEESPYIDRKLFKKTTKLSKKIDIIMKHFEETLDVNVLTEARLQIDNIKEHGSKDWYDWNISNWGCKWDANEPHSLDVDLNNGTTVVYFETAWSPPTEWVLALTKKYPRLRIKMRVTEESDAYIGVITAYDGKVIENIVDIEYPY